MNRLFLTVFFILIALVVGLSAHYIRYTKTDAISTITQLTYMTAPALGVSYFESKNIYDDGDNIVYPEMSKAQKMDFIYEK